MQDPLSSLTFEWMVDGMPAGTDVVVDVFLGFGMHEISLRVTDTGALSGDVTRQIHIDPAALAVFAADQARVRFGEEAPGVKLSGEIGLPAGVSHPEVAARAELSLSLAGVKLVTSPEIVFERKATAGKHWSFGHETAASGVRRMNIDWEGARFHFRDHDHGISLQSVLISSSETVLTLEYEVKKAGGAFAVDFGGLAQVSIDSDGHATAQGAELIVEKEARELTLTLPFPLLETMALEFTGAVVQTIPVVDHYSLSIGRFKLEVVFDAAVFPNGAETEPRTLDAAVSIGEQVYPGEIHLGPEDLEVHDHHGWKFK